MIRCRSCGHRMAVSDFAVACHSYRPDAGALKHSCPACGGTRDIRIESERIIYGYVSSGENLHFASIEEVAAEGVKANYYSDRVEISFGSAVWGIPAAEDQMDSPNESGGPAK